jgi:hypothetical protein
MTGSSYLKVTGCNRDFACDNRRLRRGETIGRFFIEDRIDPKFAIESEQIAGSVVASRSHDFCC